MRLPFFRKVRIGFNGVFAIAAVLAVPPLPLVALWCRNLSLGCSLAAAGPGQPAPVNELERGVQLLLNYQQLTAVSLVLLELPGPYNVYLGTIHLQELFGCVLLLMAAQIGGLAAAVVGGTLGVFPALTSGSLMLVGVYGVWPALWTWGPAPKVGHALPLSSPIYCFLFS